MTTYGANDWVVEPCNVKIIHCITSINIANIERNKCDGKGEAVLINKEEIVGDVKLNPGFNCAISARDNTFTIESVKGGGACGAEDYCGASRVPMTEAEAEIIEGGEFLDGCVMCNETIKAINGVSGKTIRIQGGSGVSVIPQDSNTILLRLETQQFKNGCEVENEPTTSAD